MGAKNVIMVMDDANSTSSWKAACGAVRHDRPALHGREPRRRPRARCIARFSIDSWRARGRSASATA
jgi:hypothetical protein